MALQRNPYQQFKKGKKSFPAGIHQEELSGSKNKESRLLPAQQYLHAGWVRCGPGKADWAADQLSRAQGCLCSGAGATRHRQPWRSPLQAFGAGAASLQTAPTTQSWAGEQAPVSSQDWWY